FGYQYLRLECFSRETCLSGGETMARKNTDSSAFSLAGILRFTFAGCLLVTAGPGFAQTSCGLIPAELRAGCTPAKHPSDPQRTLAKGCSPGLGNGISGGGYCEGYKTIRTGSGGAEV